LHEQINGWNCDIMKNIRDMITLDRVKLLQAEDKYAALRELSDVLASADSIGSRDELEEAILDREKLLSTGIGLGIAIPHVRLKSVAELTVAIGICKTGIDYDALDGQPVNIIIMIASPEGAHREYLSVLAKIVLLFKNPDVRTNILKAETASEMYSVITGL